MSTCKLTLWVILSHYSKFSFYSYTMSHTSRCKTSLMISCLMAMDGLQFTMYSWPISLLTLGHILTLLHTFKTSIYTYVHTCTRGMIYIVIIISNIHPYSETFYNLPHPPPHAMTYRHGNQLIYKSSSVEMTSSTCGHSTDR